MHVGKEFLSCLQYNKGRFTNTKVGVGLPNEYFLEESVNDFILEKEIKVMEANYPCFDLDKPWDILEANTYYNQYFCGAISQCVDETASIDPSTIINGAIHLGKNSKIGKNVIISGNCIIGDNVVINNGAIIGENVIVGNNCRISNYCKVGDDSTIGDNSIIDQTAELLQGVLFEKVYLYHHCEFYGICGEKVDVGAGTVCGTLRFDDGETIHEVKGRRENVLTYANATYLGDYVRTGVSVIFQPGAMVGVNSVVGSGVVLNQKVDNGKLIYCKQELIEKDWGPNKYGW